MVIAYHLANGFLAVFAVVILKLFFDMFFIRRKVDVSAIFVWVIYFIWQLLCTIIESSSAYSNILTVVVLSVLVGGCAYQGDFLKKCIFAVTFNSIAMLFETVCGLVFMVAGIDYMIPMTAGSL